MTTATLTDDCALPGLREELRLEPADAGADGERRWRFHDPLRHRSFLIGDGDVKLLSLWGCGSVARLRAALARAGAALDEAQLTGLLDFLTEHHLVRPLAGSDGAAKLLASARRQRSTGWRWLLTRYMGMRFTLWRPQAFLDRTLPSLHVLLSTPLRVAWALATGLGLLLAARQWDDFTGTFSEFLTPGGIAGYACALLALKVVHELGHAYAAAHHGARVGGIGVAVMMGMPMLFTETSDASRLAEPRQRMWIAAGGVLAETVIAGLATLAWAVLPDGSARSLAFVIATSSWLTSLLVNLNPFSRFDGYYFVSDALRIDNLQPRAVAYAGWALGRALFGAIEAAPETLPRRRAIGFALYGSAVWLYRIGLYLAAALLAYHFLFKLAGIAVLVVEMWVFVGRPVLRRAGRWWALRGRVTSHRRLGLAAAGGALLLSIGLPLDRSVAVPAVLGWQHETVLQAPENARVVEVAAASGQAVRAGDLLLRLEAPELRVKQAAARIARLTAGERLDRVSGDAQDRSQTTVLARQRSEADADLQGIADRAAQLELRAAADGVVVDVPPHLQRGQWVRPDQTLARLLHGDARDARGFVSERELRRLAPGAAGRFIADDPALPALPLELAELDTAAAEQITPPSLSSLHGGQIATQADGKGREVPVVAQHRVRFVVRTTADGSAQTAEVPVTTADAARLPTLLRGEVRVDAEPQSLLGQAGRQLWRLLMAELRD